MTNSLLTPGLQTVSRYFVCVVAEVQRHRARFPGLSDQIELLTTLVRAYDAALDDLPDLPKGDPLFDLLAHTKLRLKTMQMTDLPEVDAPAYEQYLSLTNGEFVALLLHESRLRRLLTTMPC